MNIQLENKNTMILLLLVVANYCLRRLHEIFIDNYHLETYGKIRFVKNRRNITKIVVIRKLL